MCTVLPLCTGLLLRETPSSAGTLGDEGPAQGGWLWNDGPTSPLKGIFLVNVVALIVGGCLAVVASLALANVASVQARAVEKSAGPERVHDLRVLLRRLARVSVAIGAVAGGGICGGLTNWPHISAAGGVLTVAVIVACLVLPIAAGRRPVLAAYARIRGIPLRALRTSPRRLVIVLAALAMLGWPVAVALAVGHGAGVEVAVLVIICLGVNPLALGLMAPVTAWALRARALPGDVGQRLAELAGRTGVTVRGRLIPGRARKLANAGQAGWLPGLRYVLITDYLLDELTAGQVDAIVAHELGHGLHRHVRARQFRACLRLVPITMLVLAIAQQQLVLTAAGIVLVAGVLASARWRANRAIRQELAADDLAAATVGREVVAAALERLTELNAIKRNTTLGWDRAVGHPGMAQRIARLRSAGDTGAPSGEAGPVPGEAAALPGQAAALAGEAAALAGEAAPAGGTAAAALPEP